MANDIATQLRHLEVSMRLSGGQWMLPAWDGHRVATLLEKAQASLLAKEAECEALREDAARLDYLQSRGATVEILPDGSWWKFRIGGLHSAQSPNIRAAIDAARAAADQGGIVIEERDLAHEADMERLRREQLRADISPEEAAEECAEIEARAAWMEGADLDDGSDLLGDPDEYDYDVCDRCGGDGMDPWNDYLFDCPECQGRQQP